MKHEKGTKRYELHKKAKDTLGSGNLQAAVKLPPGEDTNEWLAVNSTYLFCNCNFEILYYVSNLFKIAVDFFNQVNLLYGSITEFCTPAVCNVISAGPKYVFHLPF